MRLYSRIYKYHLRLFALTALVYAESLKKIKNFKTSSILCEAKIDEESRERTTVAAAEATATEQTKKSTRNHEDNERVLRDH